MRWYILFFLFLCSLSAQSTLPPKLEFKVKSTRAFPRLQSYAIARYQNYWLIVSGREDGVHQRQPNLSFDSLSRNHIMYLYDFKNDSLISHDLHYLPAEIREQLYSSNIHFAQKDNLFLLMGGYGYSSTVDVHITHDRLTAFDLKETVEHLLSGKRLDTTCYRSLKDSMFAVTGGKLVEFNHHFLMMGGHWFDGAYNPQGMASYVQKYNHSLYEFDYHFGDSQIQMIKTVSDSTLLRRRDLNAVVKKEADGDRLIIYAGVFRKDRNFPYENLVEYKNGKLTSVSGFSQKLCQYHTANATWEASDGELNTVFFGGLTSNYRHKDSLFYDTDVPFVNHVSLVSRDASGNYTEYMSSQPLPAQLGTAAEFRLNPDLVNANISNPKEKILLGYIIGGITTNRRNVFWSDDDSPSVASSQIVEVYLTSETENWTKFSRSNSKYNIEIFPDEDYTYFQFSWNHKANEKVLLEVFTEKGQKLISQYFSGDRNSRQSFKLKDKIMKEKKFRFHFKSPSEEYSYWVMNND